MEQITFPNVRDGNKSVTTAGVAVPLAANRTGSYSVTVMANLTNTDYVCVGDSTVVAAVSGRRGIPLSAGMSITLPIEDISKLWLDSVVNGEGVTFIYLF